MLKEIGEFGETYHELVNELKTSHRKLLVIPNLVQKWDISGIPLGFSCEFPNFPIISQIWGFMSQ